MLLGHVYIIYQETSKNTRRNKKVLLRERKRHTARRVVSTPSVVLLGYPPQQGTPPSWPDQGTPPGQGIPPARVPPHPDLAGGGTWPGTPWGGTWPGYPPARVPPGGGGVPDWVPPGQGTPRGYLTGYPPGQGTPLARVPPWGDLTGYPPGQGTPGGGTWLGTPLARVPPAWTWPTPPPPAGPDPPSSPCGQTNTCENSTFPSYYVRGR